MAYDLRIKGMNITIYHNPRCSKSRKTLEIIQEAGIRPKIVEYLDDPPGAARTEHLAALLGLDVADLLRKSESEFAEAEDLHAAEAYLDSAQRNLSERAYSSARRDATLAKERARQALEVSEGSTDKE